MALIDKLTAIADAIRAKTGKTATMTLDEMPTEIAAIEAGGDTEIEDALVAGNGLSSYTNSRITNLGAYALAGQAALKRVSLPNVTSCGNYAFAECSSLERIDAEDLPKLGGKYVYPYNLFQNCKALTSISMPLLGTLGQRFASTCTSLVNVDLPSATGVVGLMQFEDCTSLKSISLPNMLVVGNTMFSSCSNLVDVDMPCATNIEQGGFYKCTSLTYLDFPVVTNIGYNAFVYSGLTTLILRSESLVTLKYTNAFTSTPIASGTGYVYVPDELVESYKAATNWATYADQIKPLSELPTEDEEETE